MDAAVTISIFADEVTPKLAEQAGVASRLGVGHIEVRVVDGANICSLSEKQTMDAAALLRDSGIRVSAIASPIGKVSISAPAEQQLDLLRHACAQACILGTHNIRIFSFFDTEDTDFEEVCDRLEAMTEIASGYGVRLLHENESAVFAHSAQRCRMLARELFSDSFALAYDPGNFVWGEKITDNIQSCWPLLAPYVRHIHIKDWKCGSDGPGCAPGDGDAQIPLLVKELGDAGYDGFISLEPHMSVAGPFGGTTTEQQMGLALDRVRGFMDEYKIKYK